MEQGRCGMGFGTLCFAPCMEPVSPCPQHCTETFQQDPGHEDETATLSTTACRETGLASACL